MRYRVALVMLALVLSSCGGGDTSETTNATVAPTTGQTAVTTSVAPAETTTTSGESTGGELPRDPCDLVGDEQVANYLGVEVAGQSGPLAGAGNPLVADCLWQSPDTFENFSIQYFGDRVLDAAEFEGSFTVGNYVGIGDFAITLSDESGRFNSLWVQTGSYTVACYPDVFADPGVEIDGNEWDLFFPLCEEAVSNANG